MTSFDDIKETSLTKLKKYGYDSVKVKSSKETVRYVGKTTFILFKTGKLLVQGKKSEVEEASKLIEFLGISQSKYSGIGIGTDESLKGDTFGGIIVAGFLADETIKKKLKELGVKDSKKLLNQDIVRMAQELIKLYPDKYHMESILPKEYNKLNARQNVTEILNLLHERCYKKLAGRKTDILHIVDLYPGCTVGNIKETKADSKYLEVAAASIIARYGALCQIRELECKSGFFIPMGSTHVASALLELKKKSLNPGDYVKLEFRNVKEFLN